MRHQLKRFLSKTITPHGLKPTYNNDLEAYRGICAILVMLNHATTHEDLLLSGFSWPIFIKYINSGYLSVLVFFCISGYAIGCSNYLKGLNIKDYLLKRGIRLYPIYLIAILGCLFIEPVSLVQLIQNILFLQNTDTYFGCKAPIFVNFVTWSLNYEVFYYLIFIIIALTKPKVWVILLIILLFSLTFIHPLLGTEFIANYNNGFYFWLLGLMFGWGLFGERAINKTKYSLISIIFLHLCINYLGLGMIILNLFKLKSNTNINWLFDLPFCVMLMGTLLGHKGKLLNVIKFGSYFIPFVIFTYLALNGRIFENERWTICLLFWIISLCSYKERAVSSILLPKLMLAGKISYGIYLFHVPVALLIRKFVNISNQNLEIVIKYSLWVVLTVGISFIAERLIQPRIKNYFVKNARPITPLL